MLVVCGIPLLFMELGVGQYTQRGPIGAIRKLCPFFQGKYEVPLGPSGKFVLSFRVSAGGNAVIANNLRKKFKSSFYFSLFLILALI